MKIYVYDYTDLYGKPHYNVIKISDDDANYWINIDYERRLIEAKPGQVVERRTAQQIQDEIDKEFLNSDRREVYHKSLFNTVSDEEGNEISIIETIAYSSNSPLEQLEKEELRKKVDKALSILTEKQRRRVLCV